MKTIKTPLLVGAMLMLADFAFAQTWTQTSAPNAYWSSIASSADGTHLVAAAQSAGSGIYISTNSGTTWTRASSGLPSGTVGWIAVASSADGGRLAAARFDLGAIYVSGDSGTTWTAASVPSVTWQALASSANGTNFTAVARYDSSHSNPGPIYTSTNSGATWQLDNAPNANWRAVASSADGSKLIAVGATGGLGPIYTSADSGSSWNFSSSAPFANWLAVAASADGSKLIASAPGGAFYTNSGTAWIQNASLSLTNTLFAAVSADGIKQVMVAYNGGIYTSTNLGTTWTSNNAPVQKWVSVASSADGTKLAAVAFGGGIYTWQATPTPQLNLTPSPTNLALSWTIPSTNFVVQQSSDLTSWSDVTNPPVLNLTNLQNQVTLAPSNTSGFYRLKTP